VLIGTAAGLAAAFSTPIGGLLLAIEQVSHHTIPAREPAGDVTSTL
jgi:H+/Cl- antiporter ClcA